MRKVTITTFLSLDGVMQGPGGPDEDRSGGFEHGGWMVPYAAEDSGRMVTEWIGQASAFLLGRVTYDIFAAYWPYAETDPKKSDFSEIARTFNRVTKYVATHSPDTLSWDHSEWLGNDVVAVLKDLKAKDGPDLLTQGSSELVHTLLENDLIDEFRLKYFPVLLGKGKRLFTEGSIPGALRSPT